MNWNPLVLDDFGGVNFSTDNSKIDSNQSPLMYNYIPKKTNNKTSLSKRSGSQSGNVIEAGPGGVGCTGLTQYHDTSGYHTIAKFGDTIYDVQPNAEHTSLMGDIVLDASLEVTFENWLGRFYFTDGADLYVGNPQISKVTLLDQDGEELTGQKPFGKYVIQHYQRLWWIGGNSTPFFSVTDFPDRYQTLDVPTYLGCAITCDENDGTVVTGGVSYRDKLIIFKPYKMFIVVGDYALDTLEVNRYATIGAYDQKGICVCGDGFVRWYGPDGVYQYHEFTGYVKISEAIDDELEKINLNMREKVCVGWHNDLFLLFYSYNSEFNNRGIAYDPKKKQWYPIRAWNVSQLVKFNSDNTLHAGWSDSGFVKQLFIGTHDDGEEIKAYFQTKTFFSSTERCLDKLRLGNSNGETGMSITWISDQRYKTSGVVIKPAMTLLGDKLADVENLLDGGFMLSDADNLGDSYLVDANDIMLKALEISTRVKPGQRFQEIYFIFEESSIEKHQINYFYVWSYPTRVGDIDGMVQTKNVD